MDLALLLKQWHDPIAYQWSVEEFYRTVLGIPYICAEHKLTQQDVFSCMGMHTQFSSMSKAPTIMGVDIGKVLHYVIGIKVGPNQYEILKVGRAQDQYELHDIAERMNVKFAVLDHDPEIHMVEEFQRVEPYSVYLCRYSDTQTAPVVWTNTGNNRGTLMCNRTKWCDKTHDIISDKRVTIPRKCREVDEYAVEMTNTVKVLERDEKSGLSKYRYRQLANKPDHYFHATLYFLLAANQVSQVNRNVNGTQKLLQAKNEFYL